MLVPHHDKGCVRAVAEDEIKLRYGEVGSVNNKSKFGNYLRFYTLQSKIHVNNLLIIKDMISALAVSLTRLIHILLITFTKSPCLLN
jgi:hypothetical protein